MSTNRHKDCFKGFTHLSRSWYSKIIKDTLLKQNVVDEVAFGYYYLDGGTAGEMIMEWIMLDNTKVPIARLNAFEDSWNALSQFTDLIQEMGKVDNCYIQPKEFCDLLIKCGFKDRTQETRE